MQNFTKIANGLRFPEGPIAMPDGSVIVVEIEAGRITRCCLDAGGKGVMGTVWDEPGSLTTSPFELCGPCHQTVVEPT